MENNVKIGLLLDIYGELLTDKQYNLLNDYYNNDFSLSEIAENEGITRQAVRDNLKKGENNLLEFESKLKFLESSMQNNDIVNSIINEIKWIQSDLEKKLPKDIYDKKFKKIYRDANKLFRK